MRVEIVKPVLYNAVIKRAGIVEVSEATGAHWVATGAAKAVNPPAPEPAPAAERGQKRF